MATLIKVKGVILIEQPSEREFVITLNKKFIEEVLADFKKYEIAGKNIIIYANDFVSYAGGTK